MRGIIEDISCLSVTVSDGVQVQLWPRSLFHPVAGRAGIVVSRPLLTDPVKLVEGEYRPGKLGIGFVESIRSDMHVVAEDFHNTAIRGNNTILHRWNTCMRRSQVDSRYINYCEQLRHQYTIFPSNSIVDQSGSTSYSPNSTD